MPEERSAERTGQEANSISSERGQGSGRWVEIGEENPVEYERRCCPIDQEVIPLDNSTDRASKYNIDHAGFTVSSNHAFSITISSTHSINPY